MPPVKGSFDADFAAFDKAVDTSTGKIQLLEAETKKLGPAVDSIAASTPGLELLSTGADAAAGSIKNVADSAETAEQWLARVLATTETTNTHSTELAGTFDKEADALGHTAEAAGKTGDQLVSMATASAVVSTAMAAWDVGRAIANFFELDQAIANTTASLLGWGDLAAETAGAKADVLARATQIAGREITNFGEAVKITNEAFHTWDDALHRAHGAEESAKQIAGFRHELELVRSAGVFEALRDDLESHNFSQTQLAENYRVSVGAIQLFARDIKDAHTAAVTSAKEAERATKALEDQHKRYGETLKAVAKIETDKGEANTRGLLDLSALEQKTSQARFEAESKGLTQLTKAEGELRDFEMKASLDASTYQIMKIWERVDEQEKAYVGLEALRGQYNFAIESKAAQEADAISSRMKAATEDVGRAVITMAGAVGGAIDTMAGGVGGALDMMAAKADSTLAHVQTQAAAATQYTMGGGGYKPTAAQLDEYYKTPQGIQDIIRNGGKRYYEGEVLPRAGGGPVTAGMPYLVGERGPELYVPQASGTIVPSGGPSVTNHIYVNGTAADVARQVAAEIMRTIKAGQQLGAAGT